MSDYFRRAIGEAEAAMHRAVDLAPRLEAISAAMIGSLRSGGVIYWCGNGGSAGDSQHLAAELVGRYVLDREPLASVALTTDTSVLTALSNDYGYEGVFARQVQALGRPGDVIVAISTSGESPSVLAALAAGRAIGMVTVAFTGATPCSAWELSDHVVAAPATEASLIQDVHIAVGQAVCGRVEQEFFAN